MASWRVEPNHSSFGSAGSFSGSGDPSMSICEGLSSKGSACAGRWCYKIEGVLCKFYRWVPVARKVYDGGRKDELL